MIRLDWPRPRSKLGVEEEHEVGDFLMEEVREEPELFGAALVIVPNRSSDPSLSCNGFFVGTFLGVIPR